MAQEPMWQPQYVDLSDEQGIRFGAQCVICSAQYAMPPEAALPPGRRGTSLQAAKRKLLAQFEEIWHGIQVYCFGCGRAACPECWDAGNSLCADCVERQGLTRGRRTDGPTRGPLAEGRLQLAERGRYSNAAPPAWLDQLLAAQSSILSVPPGEGKFQAGLSMQPPPESAAEDMLAATQSARMPAIEDPPPFLPQMPKMPTARDEDAHFPKREGAASANMTNCPRCGTPNYDFVTRCVNCHLQLIQICPLCEKLNPGSTTTCEFCGSPLRRSLSWSSILPRRATAPRPPAQKRRLVPVRQAAAPPVTPPVARAAPIAPPVAPAAPAAPAPAPAAPRRAPPTAPSLTSPVPAAALHRPVAPKYQPNAPVPIDLLATAQVGVPERASPRRRSGRRSKKMPAVPIDKAQTVHIAYQPAPQRAAARQPRRIPGLVGATLDRLASMLLLALILVIVGTILAAEASPQANTAIRAVLHVDIRQTLAHFGDTIGQLLNRIHPRG